MRGSRGTWKRAGCWSRVASRVRSSDHGAWDRGVSGLEAGAFSFLPPILSPARPEAPAAGRLRGKMRGPPARRDMRLRLSRGSRGLPGAKLGAPEGGPPLAVGSGAAAQGPLPANRRRRSSTLRKPLSQDVPEGCPAAVAGRRARTAAMTREAAKSTSSCVVKRPRPKRRADWASSRAMPMASST